MSAVREVIEVLLFAFDPKEDSKSFQVEVPERFLEFESQPQRILDLWKDFFLPGFRGICQAHKKNRFMQKEIRQTVFRSGLENVCKDFSRRTDSIKVEVVEIPQRQHHQYRHYSNSKKQQQQQQKVDYRLRMTKLSAIPEELRRPQQFCLAEIPVLIQDVTAEAVGMTEDLVQCNSNSNNYNGGGGNDNVPMVQAVAASAPGENHRVYYDEQPSYDNVPVVECQVVPSVVVDEEIQIAPLLSLEEEERQHHQERRQQQQQSSTLCRMQELESVRTYLSPSEYQERRQAILDSI